jgi:hypothetical protein
MISEGNLLVILEGGFLVMILGLLFFMWLDYRRGEEIFFIELLKERLF